MAQTLPYLFTVGALSTALDKIKLAATPPRFTRDFLNTVLKMKGGSANAVIPFLKKVGFLSSDGTPTEVYEQFRNDAHSGHAAAQAMRIGYEPLYAANEYAHELSAKDLKGLVVQVTGEKSSSSVVPKICQTFNRLKTYADFTGADPRQNSSNNGTKGSGALQVAPPPTALPAPEPETLGVGMNLSYTINLNLPATADVEVFNAIFKSLKQNILDR